METPEIKQNPLIHLPSGSWVRPQSITAIRPIPATTGFSDRVIIHYDGLADCISFPSFDEAKWFSDQLSAQVNKPA